jgi:hypothetical protein
VHPQDQTAAQRAMKQQSKTPAERGEDEGSNDQGRAAPEQPQRKGDAGVGATHNQGSSPYQDRSRPDKPDRKQ